MRNLVNIAFWGLIVLKTGLAQAYTITFIYNQAKGPIIEKAFNDSKELTGEDLYNKAAELFTTSPDNIWALYETYKDVSYYVERNNSKYTPQTNPYGANPIKVVFNSPPTSPDLTKLEEYDSTSAYDTSSDDDSTGASESKGPVATDTPKAKKPVIKAVDCNNLAKIEEYINVMFPNYFNYKDLTNKSFHLKKAYTDCLSKSYFIIFGKTLTGKTIVIDVSDSNTAAEAYYRFSRKMDVPAENLRLIFEGKEIEMNNRPLSYYKIQKESVLHIVIRKAASSEAAPTSTVTAETTSPAAATASLTAPFVPSDKLPLFGPAPSYEAIVNDLKKPDLDDTTRQNHFLNLFANLNFNDTRATRDKNNTAIVEYLLHNLINFGPKTIAQNDMRTKINYLDTLLNYYGTKDTDAIDTILEHHLLKA